jgi:hypothetical protein
MRISRKCLKLFAPGRPIVAGSVAAQGGVKLHGLRRLCEPAECKMGRAYAGILGGTAFCIVVARGALTGGQLGTTVLWACLCLIAFSVVGALVGRIAERTVDDSVYWRVRAELKERGPHPEARDQSYSS